MDAGEPEATDAALWERARRNDADGFGLLFERHAAAVYAFCARRTADLGLSEDLTSVVFLEAWAARRRVRLAQPSALPWLLGIATNVVRNSRRSVNRRRSALARLPACPDTPDHSDEVAARVDAQRRLALARNALDALPKREREVVALVIWSALSYEQAATALGVPVGTVRSRLSRAKARLRADADLVAGTDLLVTSEGELG